MADTLAPGERIGGRYRVDHVLGEGGFGMVFRATDLTAGRAVALKVLLPEALARAEGRARFRREAELSRRLAHPHVVRLLDFGETERGLPFIVWELLEGRTLAAELAATGRMRPARVAKIAAEVLDALAAAHALGIIHRDIKPENIFLCPGRAGSETVKVLDFGIAKSSEAARTLLTRLGSILGTPAYMAPEQMVGEAVSPATDLYSLGLVMAEMLTGRPVFPEGSALVVVQARLLADRTPIAPEVLGSALGPVIAQATEREPANRHATAHEMRGRIPAAAGAALLSFQGPPNAPTRTPPSAVNPLGPTYQAPPSASTAVPHPSRPAGRAYWLVLAGGMGGALLAGGAVLAIWQTSGASPGPGLPFTTSSATSRTFGRLSNKQIRSRIEAVGLRVTAEEQQGATHSYYLSPTKWVNVYRFDSSFMAENLERSLKQRTDNVVARDGPVVLYIYGVEPAVARALVERLTRP